MNIKQTYPMQACKIMTGLWGVGRMMLNRSIVGEDATGEIAIGSKPGIDATKKLPGEGFRHAWPPLNSMLECVKTKGERHLNL